MRDSREEYSREARQARKEERSNEIGKIVVDAAIRIHRELGPGLLSTQLQ